MFRRWSPLMYIYKKACHQHTKLSDSMTEWSERTTLNQMHNYTSICTSRTSSYVNCVLHIAITALQNFSFSGIIKQCVVHVCGHSPETEGQSRRSRWCQHLHDQVGERGSRANTLRRWPQSFHTPRIKYSTCSIWVKTAKKVHGTFKVGIRSNFTSIKKSNYTHNA